MVWYLGTHVGYRDAPRVNVPMHASAGSVCVCIALSGLGRGARKSIILQKPNRTGYPLVLSDLPFTAFVLSRQRELREWPLTAVIAELKRPFLVFIHPNRLC